MREAIGKIVLALSGQYKLKVTQQGARAYVSYDKKTLKPERVNLPHLPDNASNELLDATQGFLDHEVGHLLFSDSKALQKAAELKVAKIANVLEDPFVEKQMVRRFTGSSFNLGAVGNLFLRKQAEAMLPSLTDEKQIEALLFVPAVRAIAGQAMFVEFMDDHWDKIPRLHRVLTKLRPEIAAVRCSQDNVDIAVKLKEMLALEEEEEERERERSRSKPSDDGEPGDGEDGGKTTGTAVGGSGSGKESRVDEAHSDAFDDGRTSGRSSDEEDTKPEGDKDTDEGEGESKTVAESEEKKPDPEEKKDESLEGESGDDTDEGEDKSIEDRIKDFDEVASDALSDSVLTAIKKAPYLVFTRDEDKIEPIVLERSTARDRAVRTMGELVDHMIAPMQKDVERAIAARSAAVQVPGFRSGRLNGSALMRLTMGKDDVFRRKQDNRTKDVAVSIVIDCSGSMAGSKIETAAATAYALSSVLDRLNIVHEVIGFTTRGYSAEVRRTMSEEAASTKVRYARDEALYMPIFKPWEKRLGPVERTAFAGLGYCGDVMLTQNVDGECIQIAAMRLAARRETRKVMLVLSDGTPFCPGDIRGQRDHLIAVVKRIEASGTDVVGIGILTDCVRSFYTKSIHLPKLDELPTTVLRQIKALLVK